VIYRQEVGWLRREPELYIESALPMYPQLDGTHGTNCSAFAAQGAFFLVPQHPPEKITDAQ
jgi:hypothetical protein